jgi:hypothetical protein
MCDLTIEQGVIIPYMEDSILVGVQPPERIFRRSKNE